MSRKSILNQLKEQLKSMAATIRSARPLRKPSVYGTSSSDLQQAYHQLYWTRSDFRHLHIAYCELRGRTREQIENPDSSNKPNNDRIERIKKEWQDKIDEALRANAA